MRVIVDTNVFVSAALKETSPPSGAVHVAAERDLLLKSRATEQELFVTLARPRLAPLISASLFDLVGACNGRGRTGADHGNDPCQPRPKG